MKLKFMIVGLAFLMNCMPAPKDKKDILPPPETSFGSKRTFTNMVDYMFDQMTDTSAKLKEIFELEASIFKDEQKAEELWRAYQEYEETYLKAAMRLMEADSSMDSLLKLHLLDDLNQFKNRQSARLSVLKEVRENAKSEATYLSDQMTALKIWATLPVLEKFLMETQPDTSYWQSLRRKIKDETHKIRSYPAFQDSLK